MSVDPQVIRSEPHTEVGALLQQNIGIVLDRWSRRAVEEQPNARRVHHEALQDHLHEFLRKLARSLSASEDADARAHYEPAADHGEQRWEVGWSLSEVVRDYQILRLVVLGFLEESLTRPLGYREVLAIGLALDEAITASVTAYVSERDTHLRQLEQERARETRQTQERLEEHARELREADRRKNEFLAILAHELRNPLAPIRNTLQILKLKCPPDPDLQQAQQVIERQVQQMTRMVDDLLDVARITQAKINLAPEAVELGAVVARAVEGCRPLLDDRRHQLNVTLPTEPCWLQADPSRLTQVLTNLLVNAAKYTDEGGRIELSAQREGDEVAIRVSDNGIGVPAELLPRLFLPFIQEERLADRAQGGLGLGLALVRYLVDLHQGRVHAHSEGRGKGSEFTVHLPLLKGTPPSTSPTSSRGGVKAPTRRILVVDDNRDSAQTLALLLQFSGHEVRTAHDGLSALELAQAEPPEVVLLDIGLPKMNGLEVARRMRQDLGLKDTLLVALTGYGQDEDRRRSQEAGFDAHMVKPVDLDELHSLLARPPSRARQPEAP
jgi:signal transduction histidine kinase/ActR/RegA family two-component response regulator